jgi:hypothetical protein
MAAREAAEGGQHQLLAAAIEGEAGQAQAITAATELHHRMQMATDIQQARAGIGSMAEPEGAARLGWLLGQALMPLTTVVVATDQPQGTAQQGR